MCMAHLLSWVLHDSMWTEKPRIEATPSLWRAWVCCHTCWRFTTLTIAPQLDGKPVQKLQLMHYEAKACSKKGEKVDQIDSSYKIYKHIWTNNNRIAPKKTGFCPFHSISTDLGIGMISKIVLQVNGWLLTDLSTVKYPIDGGSTADPHFRNNYGLWEMDAFPLQNLAQQTCSVILNVGWDWILLVG